LSQSFRIWEVRNSSYTPEGVRAAEVESLAIACTICAGVAIFPGGTGGDEGGGEGGGGVGGGGDG